MHKLNPPTAFLLAAIVLAACTLALGQETSGSIEGTVKDPAGALVPNLALTITNAKAAVSGTTTTGTGAGFRRTITTNEEGFFRILQVPPGIYDVVTTASSGFGEARYENVTVAIGQNTQLAITVNPGSSVTTVDIVSSETAPVDTTNSAIQSSITAQRIELLPKGVDFTSLLKAVPGTRPETRTGGFSVDGASGAENVFVIDGQEVTNFRTGTLNGNNNIPTQLLQEVQVKSSGFGAEFGGATGGVISAVTKGGSNSLHGEFGAQAEFQRFSGNPRQFLQRFSSGTGAAFVQSTEYIQPRKSGGINLFPTANLSGPFIKDKLYFFGSYSPQVFDIETRTDYFTNAPAATRAFVTAENYRLRRTYEYAFLRLDATPWDKLHLTSTFLWSPIIDEGNLPVALFNTGSSPQSFGGTIPFTNFGGAIGTLTGRQLTDRQGGRQSSNNFTLQGVYTPTSNMAFSGRFSRGFLNEKLGNYFVPPGVQLVCAVGNAAPPAAPTFPGACRTGDSTAANSETIKDVSVRTNFEADGTYIFGLGGRHELKGGYQRAKIFNDVAAGFALKGRITFSYGVDIRSLGAGTVTPTPGALGSGILRRQGTFGTASNTNQGLYIQDKYQPINRLTLNLGVRLEKENLPSFNGFAPPINFGWTDKIAPRLGFAYDLFGNGMTKIFGSYGRFNDRLKYNLPRGLFGGELFLEDFFEILPGETYTQFTLENILGGRSRFQRNLRVASNDPSASILNGKVDPNLKPFSQTEFTIGAERQLNRDYVFRTRYTFKNVTDAVEDAGVRNAQDSEAYIIGNPGEGLHLQVLNDLGYIKSATPQRRYDGLEFVLEKRLSSNWYFNANYTFSRLFGNYSGLASSDEINVPTGRLAPGTTRAFDLPFIGFTATGEPDNGRLETDRPHVFNAYGAYILNWLGGKTNSTEFSAFQTITSGTPQTTRIFLVSTVTPAIFLKRGDLGRSPTYSQTDFNVTHRYRFGNDSRFTLAGDFNVLNLFDQDTVTQLHVVKNLNTSVITASALAGVTRLNDSTFVNSYTSGALLDPINTYLQGTPTILNRLDARYGQPNTFQSPRTVRFGIRFLF
ncbi:MAG TPA: TonB-dependent receptor [Pyrinomonadaceae bacterium]|nr:TonB-dependent receptor [Pyrinomonadaceae bacterium]